MNTKDLKTMLEYVLDQMKKCKSVVVPVTI